MYKSIQKRLNRSSTLPRILEVPGDDLELEERVATALRRSAGGDKYIETYRAGCARRECNASAGRRTGHEFRRSRGKPGDLRRRTRSLCSQERDRIAG